MANCAAHKRIGAASGTRGPPDAGSRVGASFSPHGIRGPQYEVRQRVGGPGSPQAGDVSVNADEARHTHNPADPRLHSSESATFSQRIRDCRTANPPLHGSTSATGTRTLQDMEPVATAPLVPRRAADLVIQALSDTPIVIIQGARQVGKSTLARAVLAGRETPLVTLDLAAERGAALADPDAYVRRRPNGLMAIDEVQRVPDLLLAVKAAADEDRRPGRFLLTGSANLVAMGRSTESLAGRAETIPLYGLSQGEVRGGGDRLCDVMFAGAEEPLSTLRSGMTRRDYVDMACAGSFPEARRRSGRRRSAWFDNYLYRIVDRDARDLSRLAHLDRLPALVRVLAANNSGELVRARVAVDAGIPETSLPAYLTLLEDMYVIHIITAWGGNPTQRIVGRPKVALLDSGIAARLTNTSGQSLDTAAGSEAVGPLLEAFVSGEIRRQQSWSDIRFDIRHFRDRNGREVDLVLENDARQIVGIEVKTTTRIRSGDYAGLSMLRDRLAERFLMGVVLYTGTEPIRVGERVWALPISALWM